MTEGSEKLSEIFILKKYLLILLENLQFFSVLVIIYNLFDFNIIKDYNNNVLKYIGTTYDNLANTQIWLYGQRKNANSLILKW